MKHLFSCSCPGVPQKPAGWPPRGKGIRGSNQSSVLCKSLCQWNLPHRAAVRENVTILLQLIWNPLREGRIHTCRADSRIFCALDANYFATLSHTAGKPHLTTAGKPQFALQPCTVYQQQNGKLLPTLPTNTSALWGLERRKRAHARLW